MQYTPPPVPAFGTALGTGAYGAVVSVTTAEANAQRRGASIDIEGGYRGPMAVKVQRDTAKARAEAQVHRAMSACGAPVPGFGWSGTARGVRVTAMERVDGITLDKYIAMHGTAGVYEGRTLEALDVLRACGLARHGDLHPGNVIITPSGNIVIIDFGDARMGAWSKGMNTEQFQRIVQSDVLLARRARAKRRSPSHSRSRSPSRSRSRSPSRSRSRSPSRSRKLVFS